ncbi:MAG: nucleoside kinase [Bacteroidales bacterium]|nr:nucleoside kinase [Bacteroidales bacterium]MBO7320428.1 nucleoside kinase [Bacteroidales bacterium]MBO7764779.1 nucleoside kinase [Bacteroidales bacterium]
MIKIFCVNTQSTKSFNEGVTLQEILSEFDFPKPYPIIAAKVNNVCQGLKYRAFNSRQVEFLDYTTYVGRGVYCRSLCFLLCKATKDIFPGSKVVVRRPISKGYFCQLTKGDGTPVNNEDVARIKEHMAEMVEKDIQFRRWEVQADEAIETFRNAGYEDKVKLLQSTSEVYVNYYTLEDSVDYYYDALLPSTGYLKVWELSLYKNGMLLRVPNRHHPEELAPFTEQPKTFEVFSENLRWNKIMGLDNAGDVNLACQSGQAPDLIKVAEALQEKKIVQIAEEIEERMHSEKPVRLVLITGPSSSGKSTFCKRLSIQLKACGIRPISFSTDDYFVNRVETPLLPDGSYDFDNFDTVDHKYLQSDLVKLLNGEEVEVPEYNFVTGLREFNGKRLKIEPGTLLLVEGIHALNPRLTDQVPEEMKYRIFINTITSISLDDHNCIPTSDNRLLRRIVRDYSKGAFSAKETIANWPNVRRSEVQWIYPYQENADALFNSSYIVEFPVIRAYAERVLMTVPKNCPEYSEVHRLLKFLSYFTPVSDKDVPATSLIRSFIGGSSF